MKTFQIKASFFLEEKNVQQKKSVDKDFLNERYIYKYTLHSVYIIDIICM